MLLYANFFKSVFNKEIDLDTDNIRLALVVVAYTPDRSLHNYWDDVVANELANGGGYTTNGFAVTTPTIVVTAANSWTTAHAVSTVYAVDDVVRPATGNGFLYRCVVAGTSHTVAPTFPTVIGQTVVETGGVTWECVGRAIVVFNFDNITQATFTAGPFRYGVMYDRTPATDATRPLIGLMDFGSDKTGGGGALTITNDSQGSYHVFVP